MKRIKTYSRIALAISGFLAAFTILSLAGCRKSSPGKRGTIYATLASNPNYSILVYAINQEGLKETLNRESKESFTLFAPDNQAFQAAGLNSPSDLSKLPDSVLKAVLLYHVLASQTLAAQIPQAANTPVPTLNGQVIYATRTPAGKVFINGIAVTKADISCTNGVIHEVASVLMPPTGNIVQTALGNPNLSLLVAAVLRASQGATNVAAVLSGAGPFTVFAPTNQAFINAGFPNAAAINAADPNTLTKILTYHVIPARVFSSDLVDQSTPATLNGETVRILLGKNAQVKGMGNTTPSNITATNIVSTNGVVHLIDQVLLP
ncbi:MAG TPA: fasciclin domain-containing protein [Puia sp.]|uniref:fasciclin domain-containing protein n=1 Tax=Puia sp. TaxID=2045100 RepID=UPI002CF64EB9|nr:fasciclin domain-containing protein [Puia sp.]HVU94858.1 fasciclin domain-containing protein [Puia sp.]